MKDHIELEALARLVDEAPAAEERRHLEGCERCREELEELRRQTRGLGALPRILPAGEGWEALEGRLRSEALLVAPRTAGPAGRDAHRWSPAGDRSPAVGPSGAGTRSPGRRVAGPGSGGSGRTWLVQAAAALVLFVGGALSGAVLVGPTPGDEGAGSAGWSQQGAEGLPTFDDPEARLVEASELSDEELSRVVRLTEGWYLEALEEYRGRQMAALEADAPDDPITRFAALETVLAASRAAVREAPTDPFLNGVLATTSAEREATLRGIRRISDEWH